MKRTIFNGEVLSPQKSYNGQPDGYIRTKEVRWGGIYTLRVIATDYSRNEATLAFCTDPKVICKIRLERNEVYTKGDLVDVTYEGVELKDGDIYLKRNAA